MDLFGIVLKITVLLLVLIAAYEDLRHMRIRNDLCLAVAVLFVPYAFTLDLDGLVPHLVSGAIVFAVGGAMFFARLMGGGDAKMLAALALWFSPLQLFPFFLFMALAGGVLGIVALTLKKNPVLLEKIYTRYPRIIGPDDGWLAQLRAGNAVVPYGIAIAFSAGLTLF